MASTFTATVPVPGSGDTTLAFTTLLTDVTGDITLFGTENIDETVVDAAVAWALENPDANCTD